MSKILVTGATGFVGASLVKKLINETPHEIHVVTRKNSDTWRLRDVWGQIKQVHYASLENRNEVERMMQQSAPDIVYHLATYGGFPGQTDQQMIVDMNVNGIMHLVESALKSGVKQFINTGSSSEYGLKDSPMKETDICNPLNLYGITKLAATNYCYMNAQQQSAMRLCTLRLFSPYGDLEDPNRLYPSIKNALLNRESPKLSRPDSVRDFIPIDIVEKIYLNIIRLPYKSGDIINVGSGQQLTIAEFYDHVASQLNVSPIPPTWGAAAPRNLEPRTWVANTEKLLDLMPDVLNHGTGQNVGKNEAGL